MKRPAFTLLEVLCSLAISVLLLAALYVAVNSQLQSTQSTRQVIEHTSLVRTLIARMASDISANLGPVPPEPTQAATSGTTTSTTTSTTPTTPPAPTSATTGTTSSTSSTQVTGTAVQFNLGVQGDAGQLTLYVSRVHRDPRFLTESSSPDAMAASSDLRRITYWLVGGPEAPLGLARQVVRLVTSEDLMAALPPDVPDEASYLLADEVRSLRFSYFDGTTWLDSWDGTAPGADGMTPMGPPIAIAIVLGIARNREGNGEGNIREYRHVVAIPTANGTAQPTTSTTTTTSP